MEKLIAVIYLWTRDAELPINKETEDYISSHLLKISRVEEIEFSNNERLEMARRIFNKEPIEEKIELIKTLPKCPECHGLKIIEKEAGLISWTCPTCKGTGEVAGAESGEEDIQIGLYFQLAGIRTDEFTFSELWQMVKKTALEKMKLPHQIFMPCGRTQLIKTPESILSLLPVNLMCGCGNPNHYIVKFEDNREVASDDSVSGTGPDNQPTGSGDTRKPAKPKKPKTEKKARKRSS